MIDMKVAVLGNSKIKKMCDILEKSQNEIFDEFHKIGKVLAKSKHEIITVPEPTMYEIMKSYKENKGKRIYSILPLQDKEWGCEWLKENAKLADEIVDGRDWFWLPYLIVKDADILLIVSLAGGVFNEINMIKFLKFKKMKIPKKVIIYRPLLREKELPIEITYNHQDLFVYVDSIGQLKKELKL